MNTKTIEHGRKQDLKGGYADIRQISPERRLVCDPFGASGCEAFACIHKICFRRATSFINFLGEDDLNEERKKEEGGRGIVNNITILSSHLDQMFACPFESFCMVAHLERALYVYRHYFN